jgi:hypothetical protein
MRLADSRPPLSWVGGRVLTRRGETAAEDVMAEARRRRAAAYLLRDQARMDSPVMTAVLAEVEKAARRAVRAPAGLDSAVDTDWTSVDVPRWTEVDKPVDTRPVNGVDIGVDNGALAGVDIAAALSGGHDRSGGAVDTVELSTRQERLVSMLVEVDRDGRWRYPTHKDFARKLRVSPRTVARELRDLRQVYGVKTDGQLRDIAGGQNPAPQVDNAVDMTGGHEVDKPVDTRPVNGVDIAGGHDRTTEVDMSTGQDRP